MKDARQDLGDAGEDAAWRVYQRRGFVLVARNWRCRVGELDLVVGRGGLLVFCEVKTRRRGALYGRGWEAVTSRKQAKLRAVAEAFLLATRASAEGVRFDVASVCVGSTPGPGRASDSVEVELFEDAF